MIPSEGWRSAGGPRFSRGISLLYGTRGKRFRRNRWRRVASRDVRASGRKVSSAFNRIVRDGRRCGERLPGGTRWRTHPSNHRHRCLFRRLLRRLLRYTGRPQDRKLLFKRTRFSHFRKGNPPDPALIKSSPRHPSNAPPGEISLISDGGGGGGESRPAATFLGRPRFGHVTSSVRHSLRSFACQVRGKQYVTAVGLVDRDERPPS